MDRQTQLALFDETHSIDDLITRKENQWFDRKSRRIDPRQLAESIVGFANADGGRIVIGIHAGKLEPFRADDPKISELLQASFDFVEPSLRLSHELVEVNRDGSEVLVVLDISASEFVHRTQKRKCFLRVGDETRELSTAEERELGYDKGETLYDQTIAFDARVEDLDPERVAAYVQRVRAKSAESLLRSRKLVREIDGVVRPTQAGLILLSTEPPVWSYVRYLRYLGSTAETGVRGNVQEDRRIFGNAPELIEQGRTLLSEKLGTVTRLLPSGRFGPVDVLPEPAWLEALVNAIVHRSYSLHGDGIRIRDFEDRLEVESPGRLPANVRINNIRTTRYSRNPHLARALAEMTDFVRELNEGVERMFEEMLQHGLREPVYEVTDASVRVTLYKRPAAEVAVKEFIFAEELEVIIERLGQERWARLTEALSRERQVRTNDVARLLNVTLPTARTYMRRLEAIGLVEPVLKSSTDPSRYWAPTAHVFWTTREAR